MFPLSFRFLEHKDLKYMMDRFDTIVFRRFLLVYQMVLRPLATNASHQCSEKQNYQSQCQEDDNY